MADRIRVIFVDDDEALLGLGKIFLELSGEFSVDTAISATAALDILNKKNYDAIVSDYMMPVMDGIEFLKRVRATDKTIPFIIFTERRQEKMVIEALNNGANFFLNKEGDPEALFQELVHFIRQSVLMNRTLLTLAEQEQRYHDLQNANDLIQSVEPDGHFLFVNKKWQETLGYGEQDIPNLTLFDIIHEESLKHCKETFQRVISGENIGIIDAVFKTRNGMKVYVEGISECKIVDGQPKYTRGIFKDVTDRKAMEYSFQTLVRSMVGTTGLDSLRKITENVSAWLGADCVMVGEIQPDRETVRVLAMLLDGKNILNFSYALKGTPCENVGEKGFCLYPDNVIELFPESRDLVDFNIRGYIGTPLRNSSGEVIGILCALFRMPVKPLPAVQEIINIIAVKAAAEIERFRMVAALQENEERFRLLFQHVPSIAVQGYRVDGTTEYWNDASERIYGYTAEEAMGKNLLDLIIPPEMREEVRKAITYMAETGQPIPASELSLMKKDGTRVAVFSSHAIVKQSPYGMELFCIDIDLTERKQAEDLIKVALADKEVLLREVHHRVKNNLQLISGLLDMTRMRTSDESTNSILTDIMLKIQTMGQIHTRLYESKQFGKISMTGQFRDQVMALSSIYSRKGNEIICEIDPREVCLPVDQALPCALVVNEILSNAYKHAFKGRTQGKIEISAVRENDRIRITIQDNGIGLPDNFDVSSTNSLGLKLIRTLVQHQLKGTLTITSQKGTKISIEFPVITAETKFT